MTDTEKYRLTHRSVEELTNDIKLRGLMNENPFIWIVARSVSATGVKALANLEDKRVFIPLGTCVILSETSQK